MQIRRWVGAAGAAALLLAACGGDDAADTTAAGQTAETGSAEAFTLRLGYFPNVTHAPAILGVENGYFEDALGADVTLETFTFNAGTEATEALFADAIDATYIGPNPAINAFAQSEGAAVRVVSGATSGGAFLVVREGIESPEDLAGTALATPSLGNTQDVALRWWLQENGYETTVEGGGDVSIVPQQNSQTLETFLAGDIDGAWVPEPWATRLIQEGNGHVLVDEADLWPDGQFVTTLILVSTQLLDEHPDVVRNLLIGHVAAVDYANENPAEAQTTVNAAIEALTDAPLPDEVLTASWENLTFTEDPIASSLLESAEHAEALELLDPVELDGLFDLTLLNEVLTGAGKPEVSA